PTTNPCGSSILMPRYFATCARGLEPFLVKELEAIGATALEAGRGGVHFEGPREVLYRANLYLRTAVRVLMPLLDGVVRDPDELYAWVRSLNWSNLMTADHTLAVDSNVRDSNITHSQYAARRVKDAICDQFRDRVGRRPSVDTERPMIGLNLHISRNQAILSMDSSVESLHKRGYRPIQTRAPLNESLACGILMATGWQPPMPIADLLCGSGTFLIEAAWMAMKRPPGLTRDWFGFMGWLDFDRTVWNAVRNAARKEMLFTPPGYFLGSDERNDALQLAGQNASQAGVGPALRLTRADLRQAAPPMGLAPGIIISNPPYGERIGEEKALVPLYEAMGRAWAERWPGWKLFVFTMKEELAAAVGHPIHQKTPFYNGALPCHLFEFAFKS
ncbi:MAG: THUMP domain-containing class I SAM-dependent RNA methyltransferase, partial [Gemmataceae bacterium]